MNDNMIKIGLVVIVGWLVIMILPNIFNAYN